MKSPPGRRTSRDVGARIGGTGLEPELLLDQVCFEPAVDVRLDQP
jgi:hypothetical protein